MCYALTLDQVYIFDVVEVVPDASSGFKRWYRLKLLCRDEAKGPVTALCGMDGYLVSSMGQKVRPSEPPDCISTNIRPDIRSRV